MIFFIKKSFRPYFYDLKKIILSRREKFKEKKKFFDKISLTRERAFGKIKS